MFPGYLEQYERIKKQLQELEVKKRKKVGNKN